jgi:penicillin-binding protein 1C
MILHRIKNFLIRHRIVLAIAFLLLVVYYFSLPKKLFPNDYSTVVLDREGDLLGARTANDGQWRFPQDTSLSDKFIQCLIAFEDQYFYNHPGFNPGSISRAIRQNIASKKVVCGGSTITMQVIRLYRKHKSRTMIEKAIEIVLATRLELRCSKTEILSLYASHAPFGGNVVGIQAASWRYFGRPAKNLSWSEAALLAILPNSPSSIHPGKNRQLLLNKRNKLLLKLNQKHIIDEQTYTLSLLEPIPDKPYHLPNLAPQFTANIKINHPGIQVKSTLIKQLQENLNRQVTDYMSQLLVNEIHNACALIIDVKTGEILAYTANVPGDKVKVDGQDVDLITSSRSTGSILKPVLYAAMQSEGAILPGMLIPDIPTFISGFRPENYDQTYDGAVPAKRALSRSLNIPCVRMLQSYGIPKFQHLLTNFGMESLIYPPDHYGLTLIVGGAEGRLYDIAGMYYKMAYILRNFNQNNIYPDSVPDTHFLLGNRRKSWFKTDKINKLDAGAIWLTLDALLEVNRPDEESGWVHMGSSRRIAWKTGTSYGFRDAWAIGTTPEYVVGVWAGNASGEGRPGLTGIGAAAPLMFQIFSSLPQTSWFKIPYDDLDPIAVCRLSGYKAGSLCPVVDTIYADRNASRSVVCPYHKLLHLSRDRKYRVNAQCYGTDKMIDEPWFILPPAMEWFYRKKNLFYKIIPPVKPGCADDDKIAFMELIYPSDQTRIFIPRELDGHIGKTIFEVAHRNPDAVIYWHLDDEYLGLTHGQHQIAFTPTPGRHRLTVIDNDGRTLVRKFEVMDK